MEQSRRQSPQFVISGTAGFPLPSPTEVDGPVTGERQRKHALVVEATTSSLRLCRDILERSGFDIETSGSGIAALTAARERQPDLIVMDLQLPDVPGREFIGWLRDIPVLRATPIVILAGGAGETAALAHLGPNTLLRKPASALMIHRAVREAMKTP
jgi:two-component system cell cycle response regulator DivK